VQGDLADEAASADSGFATLDFVCEPDRRIRLQLLE